MKLIIIPTNARVIGLAISVSISISISISILLALAPNGAGAFSSVVVHGQTLAVPVSHGHDSTGTARRTAFSKPAPGSGTFRTTNTNNKMPATTALSAAALPGIGPFAAAAFLPACLGLWKTGYAVSYGFGGAMAASGLLQLLPTLRGEASAILPLQLHAALYVFYGVRLCLFLLHREIRLPPEIHKMKPRDDSIAKRLKRLPIIAGVSVLFGCMAAGPMRTLALANPGENIATMATLALGSGGFLLAAVADWYKCAVKARDGPGTLVRTGPFRYLRHPNYTGDIVGWTCLCLVLPLLSVVGGSSSSSNVRRAMIPSLLSSIVGWAGMVFQVMIREATEGLEKKHKEKYGGSPEYEEWVKTSWPGPMLGGSD